jgi:hypothetical protein
VSKKTAKINERDPMVAELWRFLDQDVPVPLNGPGWAKVMRADKEEIRGAAWCVERQIRDGNRKADDYNIALAKRLSSLYHLMKRNSYERVTDIPINKVERILKETMV